MTLKIILKGGEGSGHKGHAGRPGSVGGSVAGTGGAAAPDHTPKQPNDFKTMRDFAAGKITWRYALEDEEDLVMKGILQERNFTGRPTLGTSGDLDKAIEAGGVQLWRGSSEKNSESLKRDENMFVGRGNTGSGIWTATDSGKSQAVDFSRGEGRTLMRMVLKSDAKVIRQQDIHTLGINVGRWWRENAEGRTFPARFQHNLTIPAAIAGYDAVIAARGDYVILNRGALLIED